MLTPRDTKTAKALLDLRKTAGPKGRFEISNRGDEPEVLLYEEIGGLDGVNVKAFAGELSRIKARRFTLRLHTVGGDALDGVALYHTVRRHPAYVTVVVDGLAASAGSVVAMAGDRIEMATSSELMLHEAYGILIGSADQYRKQADILDQVSDSIAAIYAARAGGSAAEWRRVMREESWYTPEEAVKAKLADAVVGARKQPQNMMMAEIRGAIDGFGRFGLPQEGRTAEPEDLRKQLAEFLTVT